MKKIIFFLLLIVISFTSLFITSCAPTKQVAEVEILPADRLVKRLEANRRKIRSFEGSGIIAIESPKFNNKASFRIVLVRPDSIYLTIYGPFGMELAQALVTSEDFIFYDGISNTAYKGKANDEALKEIFKIDFAFNDLLNGFLGAINLSDKLYRDPIKYEVEDDNYVLTYIDSTSMNLSKFIIDIRNLAITEYMVENKNGVNIMRGEYSEFKLLEGVSVPNIIHLSNSKQNQTLKIEYRQMKGNKRDIKIDFEIPDDATLIEW